jgi:hypothetical protein
VLNFKHKTNHGKNADTVLVHAQGSIDEGTDKIRALDLRCLLNDTFFLKDALVRHVLGSTLGYHEVLLSGSSIYAVRSAIENMSKLQIWEEYLG